MQQTRPGAGGGRGQRLALEPERGDGGQEPADRLPLVGPAGDVLQQPDEVQRLLHGRARLAQVGFYELGGHQHLGALGEGLADVVQRQQPAGRGGQAHGQGAQDLDLAAAVGRAQPPARGQLGEDALAERLAHAIEVRAGEPAAQPLGGAGEGRDQPRDIGVGAADHLDGLGGREPGQGSQMRAEVEVGAQQLAQADARTQDLAQRLLDDLQGQVAGRAGDRRRISEVEQTADLLAPVLRRPDVDGDAGAQVIEALRLVGQTLAGGGEVGGGELGEQALPGVPHHAVDGALDQALESTDDLVDADAGGLRLGDGDLLHRVLELDARGLELLDQVGPVQELEGRGPLAVQPVLQQPADAVAGMDGVEVGGADAQGRLLHLLDLALRLVGQALGEDGHRAEFAAVGIQSLLGDAHGAEPPAVEQLLRRLERALAILGRGLEVERAAAGAPREHLEMDPIVVHEPPILREKRSRPI